MYGEQEAKCIGLMQRSLVIVGMRAMDPSDHPLNPSLFPGLRALAPGRTTEVEKLNDKIFVAREAQVDIMLWSIFSRWMAPGAKNKPINVKDSDSISVLENVVGMRDLTAPSATGKAGLMRSPHGDAWILS
ncbi:hypothetical protein P7K49_029888 [Saguinus oedipus]|uniref:Uncharacterized protein n=1 Tax=Saguinus oedipus TaxID=9490 RepID=A0ABQ9U8H3_SAGOE|nr:hypothetical protein P7K49_029888 [Saguinus oedipus]